ncbi:hypothetical protein CEXT_236691, partial [Caerostris extrusa]
TRVWRDGSESPGVSHSKKLLPHSLDQVLPIIQITLQSSQPARIKFRRRQQ